MPNTLLSISDITRETLRVLHNNLSFTRAANRQYDSRFANSGFKIGDTLRIRLPNRYTIRTGKTLATNDTSERVVNLSLVNQKGVDMVFSSAELTLSLDDFSERIIKPAASRLASEIDSDGLLEYQNVSSQVGTPGVTPGTSRVWLDAGATLSRFATPKDNMRYTCLDPDAEAATVDGLKGLFQDSALVAEQYRMGSMGRALGFNFGMDQNVAMHTVGLYGGVPLVAGAAQSGSLLITDGWPATTPVLNKGDIFTIAGVNSVNPETGKDTGKLQQFVVTANVTSSGTGTLTIPIFPAITTTGALKTVTNSPADNAAITVEGTAGASYPINMAHHKEAFALGTADLEMPRGVDMASREVYDGISIRLVRQYDINNDNFPCRLDVLYGWLTARPEYACRVIG